MPGSPFELLLLEIEPLKGKAVDLLLYCLSYPGSLLLHSILLNYACTVPLSLRLLSFVFNGTYPLASGDRGGTVVNALCYKSDGRWFDPRWCHWNFSLT